MSKEVTVTIDKNGIVTIKGEGYENKSLKKALEGLGEVIERHVGHEHLHDHNEAHNHDHA